MRTRTNIFFASLRRYWYLLLPALLLGLMVPGATVALLLAALVSILIYRKSSRWDNPWLFRLFMAGLSLRVVLITVKFVSHHFWGAELNIFGDSSMYLNGSTMAQSALQGSWNYEFSSTLVPGGYGYYIGNWFFGAVHLLVGRSYFLLHILNTLFACLATLLVYLIAVRITSHVRIGLTAMALTLFCPSQIMWSIELLKEPFIQFYIALVLYIFVEMVAERKWIYLLPLAVMWYPLGHLRNHMHALMLLTLSAAAVLSIPRNRKIWLTAILVAGMAFALKLGPSGIDRYWQAAQTEVIGSQIGFITTGGAWYKFIPDRLTPQKRTPGMTPAEFGLSYFKAVGYYLLVPFPFTKITFNKLPAIPQIIIWYVLLFVCLIPGVLYLLRYHDRGAAVVLVYLFVFTSAQALVTGNEGTAFRQRDTLTLIYFIPMSVGFFNLQGWLGRHTKKT